MSTTWRVCGLLNTCHLEDLERGGPCSLPLHAALCGQGEVVPGCHSIREQPPVSLTAQVLQAGWRIVYSACISLICIYNIYKGYVYCLFHVCIKHMLCMCTYMWEPWGVPAFNNSRPEVHAVQYYLCWPVKGGCLSVAAPHRVTPMDRFHLLCHQLCSHCMHTPHHRLCVTLHCAQTSAMICSISTTTKTTRRWPPRRDHPSR